MSQNIKSAQKLGEAKMLPLILTMSLPVMFSMMIQALYNIVDSYFVSQYSTEALAAVSLAFPIQNLIIAFAVGTAVGVGSLISRKLGEGNVKYAQKAATHGLLLSVLSWVLFLVFSLVACEAFFRLYESNEEIISMGTSYLSIVTMFSFGSFIQISFEKILQSTGNMMVPTLIQILGAGINIALDPVFIFGYFGIPAMGATGAAIATVAGQIIAGFTVMIVVFAKKDGLKPQFKNFKPSGKIIKDIYSVGIPSIIMQAIGTIMTMGLNFILAGFSAAAYTVCGILIKLQSFVFMPIFGLSSGLMPIFGYNYGAKNKKRLMSCLKIGCVVALIINISGTLAFMLFPEPLLGIFNPTPEIIEIGIPAMRIFSSGFFLAAMGITISTLFQAVGKGMYSLFNSVLRQLVVLLPVAYVLSHVSIFALWFAFPISEVVCMIYIFIMFFRLYHNKIKHL